MMSSRNWLPVFARDNSLVAPQWLALRRRQLPLRRRQVGDHSHRLVHRFEGAVAQMSLNLVERGSTVRVELPPGPGPAGPGPRRW